MPRPASSAPAPPGSRRPRCCRRRGSTSTASRWARGSAATGATTTTTASARRTARCTSTPPARRWSTPRGRCRRACPDYPSHWQIAGYFDDFVDHFGLRERDHLPHRGDQGGAGRGRRLGRDDPAARRARAVGDPALRPRAGRQRSPLGPALAGAVVPGQRDLPGRADPRPLLPDARALRGQAGRGARASATPRPTSPWSRRGSRARPTSRCGAGRYILPKYMFGMPTDHLTDSPLARGPLEAAEARHARDAADRRSAR